MRTSAESLILLVRHPETVANTEHRYVGTLESPYSERGRRQATQMARVLEAWRPDRTFTSPRRRALDLARLVAPQDAPPVVCDDIAEIDFGCAEGMTAQEMAAAKVRVDYPGVPPLPGTRLCGETWESFHSRASRAADLFAGEAGKTLAVTHGGVIRTMLGVWFDLATQAMFRLEVANGGFVLVAIREGVPRLRAFGPDVTSLGC